MTRKANPFSFRVKLTQGQFKPRWFSEDPFQMTFIFQSVIFCVRFSSSERKTFDMSMNVSFVLSFSSGKTLNLPPDNATKFSKINIFRFLVENKYAKEILNCCFSLVERKTNEDHSFCFQHKYFLSCVRAVGPS